MPKSIAGSVGRGGRNFPPADVMTVQYLLNCVPAPQGGPSPELAVDGAIGPKTIAAIEKFQRANGCICDGRVDAGGATLRALQGKANDPYPNQPVSAGGAKGASGPAGQKTGFGQPGSKAGANDPYGQKAGFGPPGSKAGANDPFGQKAGFGQPGFKTGANDPFGQKAGFGQPGFKAGANDPFGQKGGGAKGF